MYNLLGLPSTPELHTFLQGGILKQTRMLMWESQEEAVSKLWSIPIHPQRFEDDRKSSESLMVVHNQTTQLAGLMTSQCICSL